MYNILFMIDLTTVRGVMADQMKRVIQIMASTSIIDRDAPDIDRFLEYPNVVSIVGIRRCGKSTLAVRSMKGKTFGYMNFDDERLVGLDAKDLNWVIEASIQLLGEDPEYFILDEIQNVEGWEMFVTRLRNDKKIIITGSNAGLMWGDLATHLTGRHVDILLQPFSFREYLRFKELDTEDIHSTENRALINRSLESYLKEGGFPEVSMGMEWMLAYIYQDIIQKDVIIRHKVRNRKALTSIAHHLVSNHSREFSFARLGRIHDIKNRNMVAEYVGYLVEAHVIFFLERYSPKIGVQKKSPKKVYCIDNGLIAKIGFNISNNLGLLMENTVAIELKRRIANSHRIRDLYYWKDTSGVEVDFVIRRGMDIVELIQVCHSMEHEGGEIESLIRASKELDCDNLTLITWDQGRDLQVDDRTIRVLSLSQWLLGSD